MRLGDYQRAVMRVSFELEPSSDDLALLGDERRFRMYRQMVRSRLTAMAEVAFKRTLELVGEAAFVSSFARFLAAGGPQSPLIREVIAAFGVFAQHDAPLLEAAPGHTPDLLRFEHAKWEVAYLPARFIAVGDEGLRELDFEGRPVLNPLLRMLVLSGTVLPSCNLAPSAATAGPHFHLLVYRPPQVNDVRWWAVGAFFAGLLERFARGGESVAEAVRGVALAQERALDAALLDELSNDLTLSVERGVVLGVRD